MGCTQLLDQLRRGVWLPDRVVNLALQYVTTAVGKSSTYKSLKPQLEVIMFEIVFPLLCFNQVDAELWRDDPHDYVRKGAYTVLQPWPSHPRYTPRHLKASRHRVCWTSHNFPKFRSGRHLGHSPPVSFAGITKVVRRVDARR